MNNYSKKIKMYSKFKTVSILSSIVISVILYLIFVAQVLLSLFNYKNELWFNVNIVMIVVFMFLPLFSLIMAENLKETITSPSKNRLKDILEILSKEGYSNIFLQSDLIDILRTHIILLYREHNDSNTKEIQTINMLRQLLRKDTEKRPLSDYAFEKPYEFQIFCKNVLDNVLNNDDVNVDQVSIKIMGYYELLKNETIKSVKIPRMKKRIMKGLDTNLIKIWAFVISVLMLLNPIFIKFGFMLFDSIANWYFNALAVFLLFLEIMQSRKSIKNINSKESE